MRAIVLGGTGAIGGATAARLAATGWQVDVTGRDVASMPSELTAVGVSFHSLARSDVTAIEHLVGDDVDPFSREGYAPSKVAAERVALDSGLPVTVIRPSKVHGRWARNPRTRAFVESMIRGDRRIELANRGASVDHLTAAANTAALIETIAALSGQRILNSADPDTPSAEQIVRKIGTMMGWSGALGLLAATADPQRGKHPWQSTHPIVLDTNASTRLGYVPVGNSLDLLAEEVDGVAMQYRAR